MTIFLALGGIAATVVVAYVVYIRTRRIHKLTCTFATPITVDLRPDEIRGTAREKLRATFDQRPLSQLSVVRAEIRNAGTEPILGTQIEQPISFKFPPEATVLDSELVDKSREVEVEPVSEEPALTWKFRSLNQGESFTVQFLLEGPVEGVPDVSARILGIAHGIEVAKEGDGEPNSRRFQYFTVVLMVAFIVYSSYSLVTHPRHVESIENSTRTEPPLSRLDRTDQALRLIVEALNDAQIPVDSQVERLLLSPVRGESVFQSKCSVCHNSDRTEKKIGPGLKGIKEGKLPSGRAATSENLFEQINAGGNGMPAFEKLLTQEEKIDVIAYVMAL